MNIGSNPKVTKGWLRKLLLGSVALPPAVDSTAPTLSSPVDTAASATTGTGSVSTNEGNGTLYWVVSTSASAPSAAQVKLGQNHLSAAATDSGSQAVSGTGVQTITGGFTGLTASTAYYAHYMHEDAAGNQSTVSSGDGFTTLAPGTTAVEFGELTRAGAGGVAIPVGATSISSQPGTAYQITSGYLVPVGNMTAGGAGQTGNVVFDDGSTYAISTVAGGLSVRQDSEFDAAVQWTGLSYGHSILLRTYTQNAARTDQRAAPAVGCPLGTFTPPTDKAATVVVNGVTIYHQGPDLSTANYVTIRPHTGATPTIAWIKLDGASSTRGGFCFKDLTFQTTSASPISPPTNKDSQGMLQLMNNIENVAVWGCSFSSTVSTSGLDCHAGITTGTGVAFPGIKIIDCTFTDVWTGFISGDVTNNLDIIGCTANRMWNDGWKIIGGDNVRIHWNTTKNKLTSHVDIPITGITRGATTVIQFAAGTFAAYPSLNANDDATFFDVGGTTQLNGNTYNIASVNAGAETITINVDSSGFGAYTSGGSVRWIEAHGDFWQMRPVGNHTISTLTRTSNVATATIESTLPFETGKLLNIEGATDTSYNASAVAITVTSATTFTYPSVGADGTDTVPAVASTRKAVGYTFDQISYIGNLSWRGAATELVVDGQGYFSPSDVEVVNAITNLFFLFNMYLGTAVRGMSVDEGDGAVIRHNTIINDKSRGQINSAIFINGGRNAIVSDNLSVAITFAANTTAGTPAQTPAVNTNNITVDNVAASGSTSYAELFSDPQEDALVTDLATQYAIKTTSTAYAASPKVGAAGTGYVDYTARTISAPHLTTSTDSLAPIMALMEA